MKRVFLLACWPAALLAPPAAGADLSTLSGPRVSGELVAVTDQSVTLRTAASETVTPLTEVLAVDLPGKPAADAAPAPARVELTDGSTLACRTVQFQGATVKLTAGAAAFTAPFAALRTYIRDGSDATLVGDFRQIAGRRSTRDRIVVSKLVGPANTQRTVLEALEGTFGPTDEKGERVQFTLASGASRQIPLRAVYGMVLAPRTGEVPETRCRVIDAYRNAYTAARVETAGAKLRLLLVCGATVEFPDLGTLTKLDFAKGRLAFLSDLEPAETEVSATGPWADRPRRDSDLDGDDAIRLGGKSYPRGLSLHARTVLAYDLGGDYREFQAVLGVDDMVRSDSHVRVTVDGDGRGLFSAEVRRRDKPRPLTLDVRGVRRLRVTVTSVDYFDEGNQVSLGDAKLVK